MNRSTGKIKGSVPGDLLNVSESCLESEQHYYYELPDKNKKCLFLFSYPTFIYFHLYNLSFALKL